MKKYSISLDRFGNDKLNYYEYTNRAEWQREFGSWFNFDDVLARSIRKGEISNEIKIACFCDGSNNIEAYFTSNSAEYEAQMQVEEVANQEFDPEKYEYTL